METFEGKKVGCVENATGIIDGEQVLFPCEDPGNPFCISQSHKIRGLIGQCLSADFSNKFQNKSAN